jgi:hypothetical protein
MTTSAVEETEELKDAHRKEYGQENHQSTGASLFFAMTIWGISFVSGSFC